MPKKKVSHFVPFKKDAEVRDRAQQNRKWGSLKTAREQALRDNETGQTPVYWPDGSIRIKGEK